MFLLVSKFKDPIRFSRKGLLELPFVQFGLNFNDHFPGWWFPRLKTAGGSRVASSLIDSSHFVRRTAHSLASCPPPTAHLTVCGEVCTSCEITSKRLEEMWREGNPYSPELTWRKSSPGRKTVSSRKTAEHLWVRPGAPDGRLTGKSGANA